MKHLPMVIAWLSALSGCGDPEAAQAPAAEENYKAKIDALSAGQRDAVLLRAVRDAGHDCQGVVGSAYSGEHFGMPGWVARCGDGRDWMIMLGRGGQALVARREEQKTGAGERSPAPGSGD